jgi:hypothetical protein
MTTVAAAAKVLTSTDESARAIKLACLVESRHQPIGGQLMKR